MTKPEATGSADCPGTAGARGPDGLPPRPLSRCRPRQSPARAAGRAVPWRQSAPASGPAA